MSRHAYMRIPYVAVALFLFACARDAPTGPAGPTEPTGPAASEPSLPQPRPALVASLPPVCGQVSVDLLAGQSLPVGSVTVANDEDMLYVSFETTAGWAMAETHVAVASSPDELPWQNGHLVPGLFPSKTMHDPPGTTVHYAVPLSALDGRTHVAVAAHADVVNDEVEEGAWADGVEASEGGGWETYLTYEVADCAITVVVGPDGGRIDAESLALTIPPGALTSSQEISVVPIPIEDLAAPALPEGVHLLPGTGFELSPDGLEFAEPALLEISYEDTGLPLAREGALAIFTLRGDGIWVEVPGTANPGDDVVQAPIEHFSVYVVVDTGIEFGLRQGPSTYAGSQLGNVVLFRNLRTTPLSTSGLTVTLNVDGPVSSLSNPVSTPSCSRTEPTSTSVSYTCTLTTAEIAPGSSFGRLITHLYDLGSAGATVTVSGGYSYGTVEGVTAPLVTTVEPERFADVSAHLAPEFVPDVGERFPLNLTLENFGPEAARPAVYELEITGPATVHSIPPGCFGPQDLGGSQVVGCGDAISPLPSMAPLEVRTLPFELSRDGPELVEVRATIEVIDAIDTNPDNDQSTWSCSEESGCTAEEPPPPPDPVEADLSVTILPPVSATVGSPLVVEQTVSNAGPSDAPEDKVLVTTEVTAPDELVDFVFDDIACAGFRVHAGKVRVSCVIPTAILVGGAVSPVPFSVTPTVAGRVISIETEVRALDPLVDPDLSDNATVLDVLIS